MFYVCEVTGFVDWLDKGFMYVRRVLKCALVCLWPEFDCPEVILCGWHDIKIQILINWLTCLFLKPVRVYWQILHATCQPVFNRTSLTELIHFGWTTGFNWGTQTNNKLDCFPVRKCRKLRITYFDVLPFLCNCTVIFCLFRLCAKHLRKAAFGPCMIFVDIIVVFIHQLLRTVIVRII